MKELALKVFRQAPDRLNCAQSVLHAWREIGGTTALTVAELKPCGAGRRPTGSVARLCGLPARAAAGGGVEKRLCGGVGSLYCKEIAPPRNTPAQSALLRRRKCSRDKE